MQKRVRCAGLPIRTSYRTKVPGLEVRNDVTGERYTLDTVMKDGVILIDVDGNEHEVDNDEFEDKYSLN